jgi:hypothetical protein
MEMVRGRYTATLPFDPVYGYARWTGLKMMRWQEGQIDRVSSLLGLSARYLRDADISVTYKCILISSCFTETPELVFLISRDENCRSKGLS